MTATTMKTVAIERHGGAEVPSITELPVPQVARIRSRSWSSPQA